MFTAAAPDELLGSEEEKENLQFLCVLLSADVSSAWEAFSSWHEGSLESIWSVGLPGGVKEM